MEWVGPVLCPPRPCLAYTLVWCFWSSNGLKRLTGTSTPPHPIPSIPCRPFLVKGAAGRTVEANSVIVATGA